MLGVIQRAAINNMPAICLIMTIGTFLFLLTGQAMLGWLARRFFQR